MNDLEKSISLIEKLVEENKGELVLSKGKQRPLSQVLLAASRNSNIEEEKEFLSSLSLLFSIPWGFSVPRLKCLLEMQSIDHKINHLYKEVLDRSPEDSVWKEIKKMQAESASLLESFYQKEKPNIKEGEKLLSKAKTLFKKYNKDDKDSLISSFMEKISTFIKGKDND